MSKTVQDILDITANLLKEYEGKNIVSFDGNEINVGVSEKFLKTKDLPKHVNVNKNKYYINYYLSPEIINFTGHLELQPPHKELDELLPIQGGMTCGVVGSPNYGTVTMSGIGIGVDVGRYSCYVIRHGFCSNAHVIVQPESNQLWVSNINNNHSRLKCAIPLNDPSIHEDIAFADIRLSRDVATGSVVEIGRVRTQAKVTIGMSIRKYGARTGLTSGRVTRLTNIWVNGRMFRGVYEASPGFGCPGDSGSPIVDQTPSLVGVFSWGESKPCGENPKGYFFATPPINILE